jgi:hypothetical protein
MAVVHLSTSCLAFVPPIRITLPRPGLDNIQTSQDWATKRVKLNFDLFVKKLETLDENKQNDDSGKDDTIFARLKLRAASIASSVQSTLNQWRTALPRNAFHRLRDSGFGKIINLDEFKKKEPMHPPKSSSIEGLPSGSRWATAHPGTDLSGTWKPIITPEFLKEYDEYLANCGTSFFFRQLCLKFCSTTRETIIQRDNGRILELDGKSPAGGWKRSLVSSGASASSPQYQVAYTEFLDPDKDKVQVEAWWEKEGTVHHSILRNKPTVGGGEFDTLRYLSTDASSGSVDSDAVTACDQTILVTESTFRPSQKHLSNPSGSVFKPAHVRWEYSRVV